MHTRERPANIAILLANQRAGTHLIKSVLSTHPLIAAPGEVFHEDYAAGPHNFLNYLFQKIQVEPSAALPHRRIELFVQYLQDIASICQKPYVVLDIKYNSIHHVHRVWQHSEEPPALFDIIRQHSIPVIHLLRKNLLKSVVSEMRANALNQYLVMNNGKEPNTAPVHLDVREVLLRLNILKRLHLKMTSMLSDYANVLTLYYEDLLSSDGLIELPSRSCLNLEPLERIADLFNVKPDYDLLPKTCKVTPDNIANAVSNFDELKLALLDTEYAKYLA